MPIWSGGGGDGLPTGWTETKNTPFPSDVDTHGGNIAISSNGVLTSDRLEAVTGGTAGHGDFDIGTGYSAAVFGAAGTNTSARYAAQFADHDYLTILEVRGDRAVRILDASGNVLVQVAGDGTIDLTGTTGKLLRLNDSFGTSYVTIQDHLMSFLSGFAVRTGVQTQVILSGALPTVAPVSATALQVNANYDTTVVVPVTYNPGVATTATCKVELSPDNVTFSTLVTKTVPVGTVFDGQIDPLTIRVPGGWYVKLTVTNATLGTGTYYY